MFQGHHGRTIQKIATVRDDLRALDAALAALAGDPAGLVPADLPRRVEIVGGELIALAARLRALVPDGAGAPDQPTSEAPAPDAP